MVLLITTGALVVAAVTYFIATSDIWGPLAQIPGPFLSRFTRLWEVFEFYSGGYIYKNRRWHKKYGPVVRLAPGRYSISSPEAVKQVYGHGAKFFKTDFYDAFRNVDDSTVNAFTERDANKHAWARRQISNLYSLSSLKQYEPFIEDVTDRLSSRFSDFAATGETFDLPQWMQFYAFDVIGEISFNKSFGFIEAGSDHNGIIGVLHRRNKLNGILGHIPEFNFPMQRLQILLRLRNDTAGLFNFVIGAIQQRTKEFEEEIGGSNFHSTGRRDFLIKLLGLLKDGKLDQTMIFGSIGVNIGAGSDTTGLTLGALCHFLLMNPRVLSKFRDEIRTFAAQGRISNPVKFAEANDMPYLQAIIKETLRMHPGVGQILPRTVPAGGVTIDGHFFPGGTTVGANSWVVNFDERLFGANVDEFRPERWLADPEKSKHMEASLLTFGAGSRTCLGKYVSLLEVGKLVPQLFRKFDFQLAGPKMKVEVESGFFVRQSYTVKVSKLETPL